MKSNNLSFKNPLVYLITEGNLTQQNYSEKSAETLKLIEAAVKNGISLIQLREKNLTSKLIFELTLKSTEIAKNSATKILVNDRFDIALAANADGVHLTSNSISPEIVRQNTPSNFIVGVSAHSLAGIEKARQQAADFATFSPIFNSPDKGAPKGLNELQKICEKIRGFPVIALGGIDETNYKTVLEVGAAGFAAIRFLNNAKNLQNLIKEL